MKANQRILDRLKYLNLELPSVTLPGGTYVSVNVRNNIAYVAIQFPILENSFFYQGVLGDKISTKDGILAMQMCALNVLAQIKDKVGFDSIEGLNHIDVYYRSLEQWDDSPIVADGASELFLNVLEEKGKHTRAIFGVQNLPRNFCVGLTATFTTKSINKYEDKIL
jgi:enamine deaminase RidA (YjgF/YER057c/UK114 family)